MVHGPIKPCTMYKNMTNSYAPVRFSIEDNRDNPVGRSPDPSAVPPCMRAVLVMLCLAIRSPILSRRNWTIARRAAGPALFRAPAKAVPCRSCPLRAAALVRPGSPCGGWPGAGECTRRQRRCVPMPEAGGEMGRGGLVWEVERYGVAGSGTGQCVWLSLAGGAGRYATIWTGWTQNKSSHRPIHVAM